MKNINDKIKSNITNESVVNESRRETFRIRYGGMRCHWDNGLEITVECDPKDVEVVTMAIYFGMGRDRGWCGYFDGNGEWHCLVDCM
jgi:hypothetical protein